MKITISQLKKALSSKTGARALANVGNLNEMIQETLFDFGMNVVLPSSVRKVTFVQTLFNATENLYLLPEDFASDGFIDLYKANYKNNLSVTRYGVYTKEFMTGRGIEFISIENIDGKQYLNIKEVLDPLQVYNLEYYSNSVIFDQSNVRRADNLFALDTDYLTLSNDEYILFLRAFSVISGVDVRPASANTEIKIYGGNLENYYENFRNKYPSRKLINSTKY